MTASSVDDILPLAPLQEGLLFHAVSEADGADPYVVQVRFVLRGPLEPARLRTALATVFARHASLRAGFTYEGLGQPVAVIRNAVDVPLREVDLARPEELDRVLVAERAEGFDLSAPPLARFLLIRETPSTHHLVFTHHHILLDGWSVNVLRDELLECYRGGEDALSPAPSFRDYLRWRMDRDHEAARAAWLGALAGLAEPSRLVPGDAGQPVGESHELVVELPEALSTELERTARALGVTVNTAVEVGWALVLARHTHRDDVVFGATVSGRPPELSGSADAIGLFANTVPVRVRLNPAETIAALLRRVQHEQAELLPHQHFALGEIQRLTGGQPLFDTLVAFENYPRPDSAAADDPAAVAVTDVSFRDETHYPLTLVVLPGERLTVLAKYREQALDRADVAAMLDHLVAVLGTVASKPQRAVHTVALSDGEEPASSPAGQRGPEPPVQRQILDRAATCPPGQVALTCGARELTYPQLAGATHRFANTLRASGAGPGTVVGLYLARGPELVVSMLAALEAGSAFVPLDPASPAARNSRIAASAGLRVLVTDPAGEFPLLQLPAGCDVLEADVADEYMDGPTELNTDSGESAAGPHAPAYLATTSGSTGDPKLAVIRRDALANRFPWQAELLDLGADDSVLHRAPLGFDVAVMEILLPLAAGARLVIAEPGTESDVAGLLELIERRRVTALYAVPTFLDALLEHPYVARRCRSLRHVWCGGEKLHVDSYRRFQRQLDIGLWHSYGPAEATFNVAVRGYRHDENPAEITVGRANPGAHLYVLDQHLNPLPPRVTGEIYLGGEPIADGYLGDPVNTALRFVPDPFRREPGSVMYRTGDLGRYTVDGELQVRGRTDDQLKIRGTRIEPGEIESVLAEHDWVARAVVVAAEWEGPSVLSAHWEPSPVAPADADSVDIRSWLAERLPEQMLPFEWVRHEALPRIESGKIDRRACRDAPPARRGRDGSLAPQDGFTRAITEIFAEVLNLERVGADDNFFELGGNSLALVRVQALLAQRTGRNLPVFALFSRATASRLADHLASGTVTLSREALSIMLPLRAEGERPPIFCVHPAPGLSWPYTGLLRHIDQDVPVYGIQARGIAEPAPAPETLAEMVNEYLDEVRAVAPHGPYNLVGWSFGGVVAHAMAERLQAEGAEVGVLAMLDAHPRYNPQVMPTNRKDYALRELLVTCGYDLSSLGNRSLDTADTNRIIAEQGGVLAGLGESSLDVIINFHDLARKLQSGAQFGTFDGNLLYFTATEDRLDPAATFEMWRPYVSGTIVNNDIACRHGDMTKPGPIAEIGAALNNALSAEVDVETVGRQKR